MIENIEGLQEYTVSYMSSRAKGDKHYSKAQLMYKGYKIELPIEFYPSIDQAVSGLKSRIIQASKDFNLNQLKEENESEM